MGHDFFNEPRSLLATREGEGCMKDTDHHMRHPRGHLGHRASAQETRGCAWRDDQFGRGQNTVLGWSDPTFAHDSVAKVSRGSLQPNKKLPSVLAARIWSRQLKKVGITYFSFVFSIFFSLGCAYVSGKRGNKRHENEKSDTERKTRLGGSDPTFSALSRPKEFVGSLPPVT